MENALSLFNSWGQLIIVLGVIAYWRKEHREDIQRMDDNMKAMDAKWDANMKALASKWETNLKHMDDKWDANMKALDSKWETNLKHMDDKWERLFSLFVQK